MERKSVYFFFFNQFNYYSFRMEFLVEWDILNICIKLKRFTLRISHTYMTEVETYWVFSCDSEVSTRDINLS